MQEKFLILCLVYQLLTLTFLYGYPTSGVHEALTRDEEIKLEGRAYEPSHQLQAEHREVDGGRVENIMKKVLNSKTASAVDKAASSVVKLAGGVMEDLGDFVVDTIDQLPRTIDLLSDAVGKAVDQKREKVLIMVKGVKNGEKLSSFGEKTTTKLASAVENSEFHSSLQRLEDAFASLMGKVIGVTYKNAENISSAFNKGIRRIAGTKSDTKDLQELSRSSKDSYVLDEAFLKGINNNNDNNINISNHSDTKDKEPISS